MKYFKRISAFLLAGIMSVSTAQTFFAAEADGADAVDVEQYADGLMEIKTIDLGEDSDEDTSLKLYGANSYSYTEFYDWGNTASYYFYNQLSDDYKAIWDDMYEVCNYYLNTTQTYDTTTDSGITYGMLDAIDISDYGLNYDSMQALFLMFKYSNPQFFFIESGYGYATTSVNTEGDKLAAPGMQGPGMTGPGGSFGGGGVTTLSKIYILAYEDFASGSTRYSYAKSLADTVDSWVSTASAQSTDLLKEKTIHDTLCKNTTYDDDFSSISDSTKLEKYEQSHYTQSVASAMLGSSTVCAGYASAFALVCNAAGLDCVAMTSDSHAWNRVRIDGIWYNVDPTWDDEYMDDSSGQYSTGYYTYFNISTSKITGTLDQANAHVQESFYATYMPASICDKDSTASGSSYGSLASATGRLNVSDAGFALSVSSGKYTLSASSPASNVTYYYYVNGTASPVQNKSGIYASSVSLGSSMDYVTVIAVRADYTDSIITLKAGASSGTASDTSDTAAVDTSSEDGNTTGENSAGETDSTADESSSEGTQTSTETGEDSTGSTTVNTDCEHESTTEEVITAATTGEDGSLSVTCEDCGATWTKSISRIESITLAYKKRIYTGDELKPKVTVIDTDGNQISSNYYTVTYSDNKNVGVARVRIEFKDRYSGTVTRKFTIRPAGTTLAAKQYFTYNSKKVRIYVKAQKTQTTGYEIQYSTKKSMKNALSVSIKNAKKSVVLKKLSKNTQYFLRVRTYKTVKIDGVEKTIYSRWSIKYNFKTRS